MKTFLSSTICVAAVSALLSMSGCVQNKAITENPVTFDSLQLGKKYHLLNNENNPACTLSIKLTYPQAYDNAAVLENMQHVFLRTALGDEYAAMPMTQAVDLYVEKYITAYKELEKNYNKNEGVSVFIYEEQLNNSIEFNKGGILSFATFAWNYTGGAHGNSTTKAIVLELSTGNVLNEKDIFEDNVNEQLSAAIVKSLMANYNATSKDQLKEEGFSEDIAPNGNFLINEEGVTFIYNPYEIAPYAVGTIKAFVPYAEIAACIKKDSPVAKFL